MGNFSNALVSLSANSRLLISVFWLTVFKGPCVDYWEILSTLDKKVIIIIIVIKVLIVNLIPIVIFKEDVFKNMFTAGLYYPFLSNSIAKNGRKPAIYP